MVFVVAARLGNLVPFSQPPQTKLVGAGQVEALKCCGAELNFELQVRGSVLRASREPREMFLT